MKEHLCSGIIDFCMKKLDLIDNPTQSLINGGGCFILFED